jgi:hypothetical protein
VATGARARRLVLSGAEALTGSERRVAGLASERLTNRDIAETLVGTEKPVRGPSRARQWQAQPRSQLQEALGGRAEPAAR